MKLFLAVFLALLPALSFAQPQNETIFSILKSWYERDSHDVKWKDMKGSFSGRCYFSNKPDQAYPFLLTYVPSAADDGPAFPEKLPLILLPLQWSDPKKTALDYDNMSAEDVKSFQTYLQNLIRNSTSITEDPTVTQKFDLEPNNRPDFMEEYRRHPEGYIINRSTNLIAQNLSLPSGNTFVKADEVFSMCYFFKQVGE